jgi:hypothetical protein
MATSKKTSSREIPSIVTEAIEGIVQKFDITAEVQRVIEEQVATAISNKKLCSSRRLKISGLLDIAKDVLNKATKSKLENSSAVAQVQPIQGLNNSKITFLLQGLMGLGTLLKSSANIASTKPSAAPDSAATTLPTTQPQTTQLQPAQPQTTQPVKVATALPTAQPQTVQPVRVPAKREEKDFIKDKEPQVVLLGGITNEGISDLQKKLPVVLKDVLDELKKGLKDIKFPEIKAPAATSSSGGGGLIDSLLDGGIIGTALDFFKKKKGTAAGNIARGRKAKQLRAERAARKATTSTSLKTTEVTRQTIPKDGTPESKATRSTKAQELRAERAARKAETGTTLKAAESKAADATLKTAESGAAKAVSRGAESGAAKAATGATLKTAESGAAKAVSKGAGKAVAKGAGKAILKSGLKKIPILGAVAGLGFGAQRALKGDWLGAAGEVASGAAGSIPGLGTAASVGIDAALAARDISKEVNEPEAPSDEIKEAPPTPVESGETVQPFREGNQDLKPVGETAPQTAPQAAPPAAAESNPNKDVLAKIAENTSNTNSSIGALIQAIYKLAQSMSGKTGAPPVIVNEQQKQDVGPSASQVAAANNDPIRLVRSQFAL